MLYENLAVNEKGNLCFCGHDTVELAKKYGTPAYIMDENGIAERMNIYKKAMDENFAPGSMPFYASKALCTKGMCRIAAEQGIGLDVVSAGELFVAVSAGFPMERVCFHGSSKTVAEVKYAIENGIGYFVCDNFTELENINKFALEKGIRQKILLRVTPGIDPHTFDAVATGLIDSKFGLPIATGQAEEFAKAALDCESIELCGFHCHIGSQIFDKQPLCDAATVMAAFVAKMRDKLGYIADIIDLGGGFGVRYVESDPYIDIADTVRLVSEHFKAELERNSLPEIKVFMEPGRSIVADMGITLYEVQDVKYIPGFKNYIAVDGGMTDNPRYALYGSNYTVCLAQHMNEPDFAEYTIAGRCCESGDMIQERVSLPEPKAGDILAVLTTGAYNYAMASHYNCMPKAPIVMIKDGKDYISVRRESFEEMLACQL